MLDRSLTPSNASFPYSAVKDSAWSIDLLQGQDFQAIAVTKPKLHRKIVTCSFCGGGGLFSKWKFDVIPSGETAVLLRASVDKFLLHECIDRYNTFLGIIHRLKMPQAPTQTEFLSMAVYLAKKRTYTKRSCCFS